MGNSGAELKWNQTRAWEWYNSRPWIVGCNYIPGNCINGIEIWQEEGFSKVLETVDYELGFANEIGLNSIRMVMPFYVWKYQREGFKKRLDQFLKVIKKRNIALMPVLFDDCCLPREFFKTPYFGKQPEPILGHHGGLPIPEFDSDRVGYNLCDDAEKLPDLMEYVKDLVSTFASDERIIIWDIWNEPGNSNRKSLSIKVMEDAFMQAREQKPVQPLTAAAWFNYPHDYFKFPLSMLEIEKRAVELSDIVSFHYYGDYEITKQLIEDLKKYNRPVITTEWLHRPFKNLVESHLPLYRENNIGCYSWGLLTGKTQTNVPWDSIRNIPGINLNVWQHDLFHEDGTPYDSREIDIFKKLCK